MDVQVRDLKETRENVKTHNLAVPGVAAVLVILASVVIYDRMTETKQSIDQVLESTDDAVPDQFDITLEINKMGHFEENEELSNLQFKLIAAPPTATADQADPIKYQFFRSPKGIIFIAERPSKPGRYKVTLTRYNKQ